MKTAFLLLLFALTAFAQPNRHEAIVVRLTADLMARNINGFASDLNGFYSRGPVTRDFATALSNALSDKTLAGENLTPLINGLLEGFDAAFAWKGNESSLLESDRFRNAVKQIYYPLTGWGQRAGNAGRCAPVLPSGESHRQPDRPAYPPVSVRLDTSPLLSSRS